MIYIQQIEEPHGYRPTSILSDVAKFDWNRQSKSALTFVAVFLPINHGSWVEILANVTSATTTALSKFDARYMHHNIFPSNKTIHTINIPDFLHYLLWLKVKHFTETFKANVTIQTSFVNVTNKGSAKDGHLIK